MCVGYPPDGLVGRRIVALRPMTKKEAEQEGWSYHPTAVPTVLELDDKSVLFPAADGGNGKITPAQLVGNTAQNRPFVLLSVMEKGTKIKAKPVEGLKTRQKTAPHVIEMGTGKSPG